ncbi:class I SAM-dependent methyltransferase [Fulvimarina sp. MAC3]|uniref:class I SAM-dependent methyltransferase n=1 Tax=Fulvimarina sp. MAC3 TaxID=3148887 RepID=UPI0031FD8385
MSITQIVQSPDVKEKVRRTLKSFGFETDDWVRVMMYRDTFAFIRNLGPETIDTLEISGGVQWRREFEFKSYRATQYPGFDVCAETLDDRYDLIIADQVFEHLKKPGAAARNIYTMLKPGGYFIIATPFLLRVHASPIDCNRWTETGLAQLLEDAGFPSHNIQTRSWGNRSCVKANFSRWAKPGLFGSLKNEPNFPVMVWAYARKPINDDRDEQP